MIPLSRLPQLPFVPFFPALFFFLSFAKPTVNIKLPKPQSEESFFWGKSTFLKHMHFQFPFCSVIKSSICADHRGFLRPLLLWVPSTSTHFYPSRNLSLGINNLTQQHRIDQLSLFCLLLQESQQSGPSDISLRHTFNFKANVSVWIQLIHDV